MWHSWYKHVKQLVQLDSRGNVLVAPSPVEEMFFRSWKRGLSDHVLECYELGLREALRPRWRALLFLCILAQPLLWRHLICI